MSRKYEPEAVRNRLIRIHGKITHKRQTYMRDLVYYRRKVEKDTVKTIKDSIGPKWYQALSCPQREALDTLKFGIYQDILEGRPIRSAIVMKQLGLYPKPNDIDLMICVYHGRDDPKQMLAKLYNLTYALDFSSHRLEYPLKAKQILSAIAYLGHKDLIRRLRERFPWVKNTPRLPLPNEEELNAYEEPAPKPDVTIKPSPEVQLPKRAKKMSISVCEKLAGIERIEPYTPVPEAPLETQPQKMSKRGKGYHRKLDRLAELTKTLDVGQAGPKVRLPAAPSTGIDNAQYIITGVYKLKSKLYYTLGNVSILPSDGTLIHGGFAYLNGNLVNVHCGYQGPPPPPPPDPCDCMTKWQDVALDYVKRTKCKCEHYYDYGNEGKFPSDELLYFERPTKHLPYQFNYDTIFDMDEKRLFVRKEFKRFWDTDSVINLGKIKTDKKKKKIRRSSATCLGEKPKPKDYLRCALRPMALANIAAKLPDMHLVPELLEWMRYRMYGPFTPEEKKVLFWRSGVHWLCMLRLAQKGFGHVFPPKEGISLGPTTWAHKQKLQEIFQAYTHNYRVQLYQSYANVTNMLWPTMLQAQFPDKSFRKIYFSYLGARLEDIQLVHPYSMKSLMLRLIEITKKGYRCPLRKDD